MEFERIFEEDESMENANSQFAALTLEEHPHADPRPKRFGEPMEEIYALKKLKIGEEKSMPEQLHGIPLIELADAPETGPQEPEQDLEHDDGDDDQDSDLASESSSDEDSPENGNDDTSNWLVTFLKAVLDDDEEDEDPSLNFKEKRRQFRKRVNKCLAEALGSGDNDDVVSSNEDGSDEDDDNFLDEDDDILSIEDGEKVSDKDDEEISDVDDDIFSDEEDVYLF